jgi:enoyl-CoA hydratase/carnithine racemase
VRCRPAAELASLSSPRSMRIIEDQLRRQVDPSLGDAIALADAETAPCLSTEDFSEGVASFVAKRAPGFTGR